MSAPETPAPVPSGAEIAAALTVMLGLARAETTIELEPLARLVLIAAAEVRARETPPPARAWRDVSELPPDLLEVDAWQVYTAPHGKVTGHRIAGAFRAIGQWFGPHRQNLEWSEPSSSVAPGCVASSGRVTLWCPPPADPETTP